MGMKISVAGRTIQWATIKSIEEVNKQLRNIIATLTKHRHEYAEAINALYTSATSAELADATSDANTKGKEPGKRIYCTDASPPQYVFTNGSSATSAWLKMSDLTTFTTPS